MSIYTVVEPEALRGQAVVAAIGNFDGVHPGHRAIFEKMNVLAGETGCRPLVITFSDNPKYRMPGHGHILPDREQEEAMRDAGVTTVLKLDFPVYREFTAERFVKEVLAGVLDCRAVLVGEGFRFGKDRGGDTALLKRLLEKDGRECIVLPLLLKNGEVLSSTRIRECLSAGEVEKAADLLGREISYTLPVCEGRKLGRTIGFPTVNQRLPDGVQLPAFGVYASEAYADGAIYRAITDLGVKPTVGTEKPIMETYLFGFSGELYGKEVRVTLKRFLRPEKKFESIGELQKQIAEDIEERKKI